MDPRDSQSMDKTVKNSAQTIASNQEDENEYQLSDHSDEDMGGKSPQRYQHYEVEEMQDSVEKNVLKPQEEYNKNEQSNEPLDYSLPKLDFVNTKRKGFLPPDQLTHSSNDVDPLEGPSTMYVQPERKKDFICNNLKKRCSGKLYLNYHERRHFEVEELQDNAKCNASKPREECNKNEQCNEPLDYSLSKVGIANAKHKAFVPPVQPTHSSNDIDPLEGTSNMHVRPKSKRDFICSSCGRSFARKDTLINHYKVHSDKRPFICNICNKGFKLQHHLDVHLRTHSGERPFVCKKCGERFSQKSNLTVHSRTHTGEKRFQCDECDEWFSHKSNLTNHLRTHSGEKPYKCNECGESFSQSCNLAKHSRIHTGEKPYKCSICGREFSDPSSYNRHRKNIHGEK